MIRPAFILALVTAGGQALALAPPLPACVIAPGTVESGYWFDYDPTDVGNGFVAFETLTAASRGDDMIFVLEHCPERRVLIAKVADYLDAGELPSAVRDLFHTMVYGSSSYTMDQMVDVLNGAGAQSVTIRVDFETCACATFAGG